VIITSSLVEDNTKIIPRQEEFHQIWKKISQTRSTSAILYGIQNTAQPNLVEGGLCMLGNLKAEMARHDVSMSDIATAVGKSRRTISDAERVRGERPWDSTL